MTWGGEGLEEHWRRVRRLEDDPRRRGGDLEKVVRRVGECIDRFSNHHSSMCNPIFTSRFILIRL